MKIIKKYAPYLAIILLIFPAVFQLSSPGFFTMHDDEQIARLFDLDLSLRAFHFPPRLVSNLGFGYGYPFFNFYPPFAYYVGEIFHVLGFGYIDSTKLMLVSGFVLSALFMYIFARLFFGRLGAITAAAAYTYSSYHAIDVYVRGAFAEFYSFVFIPLIFWAVYRLSKKLTWPYLVIGAFGVTGLILSHNLIALMTLPFLVIWFSYSLCFTKKKTLFVNLCVGMLLLGFGVAAYFWLPSFMERQYTIINILTSELANYSLHFVCVHQLWESPWGYGGSIQGCFDGISFEIGKIQLIASFTAFLLALWAFLKHKKSEKILPIILFFVFLLISMFLMTKYSKFIWDLLPPLWYIQFPWRFLLTASFFAAFLTGGVVGFIKNKNYRLIAAVLVVCGLFAANISNFTPQKMLQVTDIFYIDEEKIKWETSSLAYEYVPKGIKTKKSDIGTTKVDIQKKEISRSPYEVISGDLEVVSVLVRPHFKEFKVESVNGGVLQINTFSFPGWEVKVDGKKAPITDANKLKLIRVYIPPGPHEVSTVFRNTLVRSIGNVTSVISIIILVTGSIWYLKGKGRYK